MQLNLHTVAHSSYFFFYSLSKF